MDAIFRRLQRSNLWLALGTCAIGFALFWGVWQYQQRANHQERQLLSSLAFVNPKTGQLLKIVKLRENGFLAFEVFRMTPEKAELIQRVDLRDIRDAQFQFRGSHSNLIVQKMDASGKIIMLIPGMDDDLVAHLNAFMFDPENSQFIPLEDGSGLQ